MVIIPSYRNRANQSVKAQLHRGLPKMLPYICFSKCSFPRDIIDTRYLDAKITTNQDEMLQISLYTRVFCIDIWLSTLDSMNCTSKKASRTVIIESLYLKISSFEESVVNITSPVKQKNKGNKVM